MAETAKWVTPGGTDTKGTLTLKLNGGSAKTCTVNNEEGVTENSGVGNYLTFHGQAGPGVAQATCEGGTTFQISSYFSPAAFVSSAYRIELHPVGGGTVEMTSPYGNYSQQSNTVVPFTNAVEKTPSRLTFSNTKIGEVISPKGTITLTGTLNVTGSAEEPGTRTLTH